MKVRTWVLVLGSLAALLSSACLRIERERLYTSDGNTYNFGEVKNDTDSYYEGVTVGGTYYDSAGNIIPSPSVPVSTCTTLVGPHDTSPFKLVAPPEQAIGRYELRVEGTPTTDVAPTYLSLQNVSVERTGSGASVYGTVKNNGDVTYSEVRVCAAFYKDGMVVGRGFAYLEPGSPGPDDLAPQQEGSFSIAHCQLVSTLPEGTTEVRLWVDGSQAGSLLAVMPITTAMMPIP